MKSEYEILPHGSREFPIGLHKTVVPSNLSVGEHSKYSVLYAHWHPEFELFYLSRGECTFVIDGDEFSLSAGDAAFVPANAVHSAYRLSSKQETAFYAVVFSRALLGDYSDAVSEKYINPVISGELIINPVLKSSVAWQRDVLECLINIMSMYRYAFDTAPGNPPELPLRSDIKCPELAVKSLLLNIWRELIIHAEKAEKRPEVSALNHERVRTAIEYIHLHYPEPISLEDMASNVYMSREYFSRMFKENTRQSPFEYLVNYRISRSMELLQLTDLKIIEIAEMCGFAHVSHFNRKFSEAVKCTPTEYRKGRGKW